MKMEENTFRAYALGGRSTLVPPTLVSLQLFRIIWNQNAAS